MYRFAVFQLFENFEEKHVRTYTPLPSKFIVSGYLESLVHCKLRSLISGTERLFGFLSYKKRVFLIFNFFPGWSRG